MKHACSYSDVMPLKSMIHFQLVDHTYVIAVIFFLKSSSAHALLSML